MLYLIAAVRCNLFAPIKTLFKLLLPHACRTPMVDFFLHLNVSMFPSTVILKTKGSPEISFEAAGIKAETSQIRDDAVNHLTATIDTLRMFSVQKMGPRKNEIGIGSSNFIKMGDPENVSECRLAFPKSVRPVLMTSENLLKTKTESIFTGVVQKKNCNGWKFFALEWKFPSVKERRRVQRLLLTKKNFRYWKNGPWLKIVALRA